MSSSLRPHGLQHAKFPCPSPSPWVCPSLCHEQYIYLKSMATIKKKNREQKIGKFVHCWWEREAIQLMWKILWHLLKKLKYNLSMIQQTPFLGTYTKWKARSWRDVSTSMFITAVFTIVQHGSKPGVHWQMSGKAECDTYTQWNVT